MSEADERWCWTVLGTVALLFMAGPAIKSPDGMEMLRLGASWLGHDVAVGDPHFWPPLWSLITLPAVGAGLPVEGARIINLMCWGLVIWPLHRLTADIGGRSAARNAVIIYMVLPMLSMFSTVLDARALGALITTSFVAASVQSARSVMAFRWVVFFGAIAPLARPEGIMLTALIGPVALWSGRSWWKTGSAVFVALLPHGILRGSFRGLTGHEQLFAPWYRTWSTWDMITLFGPASVPTDFRRFALAAMDAGVVKTEPAIEDVVGVLMAVPGGLIGGVLALAGTVGFVGIIVAIRGLFLALPERGKWWVALFAVLPFVAIAAAPMAKDQAGPLSNFLFMMPALIAMMAIGMRFLSGPRWVPWLIMGFIAVESYHTPLMTPAPYFLEGSEAADLARTMLKKTPPASGYVATDFSGRDVVFGAGLKVRPLGPIWSGPVPGDVDAVLINSVGASGEDGGRTLTLLESREWAVVWVVGDGDLQVVDGQIPDKQRWDRGWYALLRRR